MARKKKTEASVIRNYLAKIGRRGGQVRSSRMSPSSRTEAARHAANTRWRNSPKEKKDTTVRRKTQL